MCSVKLVIVNDDVLMWMILVQWNCDWVGGTERPCNDTPERVRETSGRAPGGTQGNWKTQNGCQLFSSYHVTWSKVLYILNIDESI